MGVATVLVVICVLVCSGDALTVNDCPPAVPRDMYTDVFAGMCYRFVVTKKRSYYTAEYDCNESGGALVTIKTAAVNNFIRDSFVNKFQVTGFTWTGLTDAGRPEGDFTWSDRSPYREADYSNWDEDSRPPQISDHDCVAMSSDDGGLWHLRFCHSYLAYVCQYKPRH